MCICECLRVCKYIYVFNMYLLQYTQGKLFQN